MSARRRSPNQGQTPSARVPGVFLALAILLSGCVAPAPTPATPDAVSATTILLVRHTEKERTGSDPPLTAAGHERARRLAAACADAGLSAIYTSAKIRTKQTAAPLAERLGLTPIVIPGDEDPPRRARALAAHIFENHAGETILIVGHSHTLPDTLKTLGVRNVPKIGRNEFDSLYVVVVTSPGAAATLVRARYGR